MDIHLQAILGFTARYQGFDPSPHGNGKSHMAVDDFPSHVPAMILIGNVPAMVGGDWNHGLF